MSFLWDSGLRKKRKKGKGGKGRGKWRDKRKEKGRRNGGGKRCVYICRNRLFVLSEENSHAKRNRERNKGRVLKAFKCLIMIIFGIQTYSFL